MAMTKQEFGQTIKDKYPQYAEIDNIELADKVLTKYPVYNSQIQEKTTFLQRAGQALKERGQEIKKTFTETAKGDITPVETGIRTVGDAAGTIGDVFGAAISPAIEKLAEKEWAKPAFEALSGGMEKYEDWKNSSELNRRSAEVIESIVNIGDIVATTAVGRSGAKQVGKITTKVGEKIKPTVDSTGATLRRAGDVVAEKSTDLAEYGLGQTTGLKPTTIRRIINEPEKYTDDILKATDADSVARGVKSKIDARIAALKETGSGYDDIRRSAENVEIKPGAVKETLEKYNINIDSDGKVVTSPESIPLTSADKNALQSFLDVFGNETELSANSFLNARTALSNMSAFETGKSTAVTTLAKELRRLFDEAGKKQIKGLEKLDKVYSSEVGVLKQIKKDFLTKTGEFKDGAVNKISNLGNKEPIIKRLENIVPDIRQQINVLEVVKDIEYSKGQKVGTYARSIIGAGGAITGNVPAMVLAIVSSPEIAVGLLRKYGKAKLVSKALINSTITSLKNGTKLVGKQIDLMKNFLNEKVDNLKKWFSELSNNEKGFAKNPFVRNTDEIADDIADNITKEARKYKTTINIQDKNDLEYLERILSKDQIDDIKSGKMTNFRGTSYEDLAKVNIISETPKTVKEILSGKIKKVDLQSDTFYHGTNSENANKIMFSGFKKGSDLPEDAFRGGGYGRMQNSISLAETPKEASIFSQLSRDGKIVEAKLKPNAKVVSIEGIEDAADLEDYIDYLVKEKIDAVYIGGGEKELVIINPRAITPVKIR